LAKTESIKFQYLSKGISATELSFITSLKNIVMKKMKYFPIFSLIILLIALPTKGQYAATPIKNDTYYFISNKSMHNDQGITYSKERKNLLIAVSDMYN